MTFKGGRLELLVPHFLRGQILRPGFLRMVLGFGIAKQMPEWAKLQFIHCGVAPDDLDQTLARIKSLPSWVDEWERLGRTKEGLGRDALAQGDTTAAAQHFLAASAAFNFAQYVLFQEIARKRSLHDDCVRTYREAAPLFDPPAQPFEVMFRRRPMRGYLRVPHGSRLAPVVVIFNGTNAVKEELHWWADAMLERGMAVITFDGPGLGQTFHRMSMVAEPRPVGRAILNQIEAHPDLDSGAVAFMGLSLGGYLAIRMAAHDPRIKAVAAVSPPYAASIYWNVTLAAWRRELASLYGIEEREMGAQIEKITLTGALDQLHAPLMVSGGGHDHLTPGREAWRIYESARCERELVFYPRGGHECFNVLADLKPRMAGWLARQLEKHRGSARRSPSYAVNAESLWSAAEAVDPEFADALTGEIPKPVWNRVTSPGVPVRWSWPWARPDDAVEVVLRTAAGENGVAIKPRPAPRGLASDTLAR